MAGMAQTGAPNQSIASIPPPPRHCNKGRYPRNEIQNAEESLPSNKPRMKEQGGNKRNGNGERTPGYHEIHCVLEGLPEKRVFKQVRIVHQSDKSQVTKIAESIYIEICEAHEEG